MNINMKDSNLCDNKVIENCRIMIRFYKSLKFIYCTIINSNNCIPKEKFNILFHQQIKDTLKYAMCIYIG